MTHPESVGMPTVKLIGNDGNAFAIMGACRRAMQKAYREAGESEVYEINWKSIMDEMTSGDYDNLLQVACTYFDVQ